MPKPVYATADELAEAVKKLEGQVGSEFPKLREDLPKLPSGFRRSQISAAQAAFYRLALEIV